MMKKIYQLMVIMFLYNQLLVGSRIAPKPSAQVVYKPSAKGYQLKVEQNIDTTIQASSLNRSLAVTSQEHQDIVASTQSLYKIQVQPEVVGVTFNDVKSQKILQFNTPEKSIPSLLSTNLGTASTMESTLLQSESRSTTGSSDLLFDSQIETQPIQQIVKQKPQLKSPSERNNIILPQATRQPLEQINQKQIVTTEEKPVDKMEEKPVAKVSFLQSIQDFFTRKEDVNAVNRNGKLPLQQAIFDHDPKELNRLIALGAKLDVQDRDGNGLLHLAVQVSNSNEKVLKTKSNFSQDDIQANLDMVKLLVKEIKMQESIDFDLLNQKNKAGKTPLHVAVDYVNELAVKELIAAGADVNVKDKAGRTPVMAAVSSELPAYIRTTENPAQQVLANIIKKLIDARADLTIPDKNGRTVRDEALYQIKQYKRLTPEIGDEIHKALFPSSVKKAASVKPSTKRSAPTTTPIYKSLSEIQKNSSKTVAIYSH